MVVGNAVDDLTVARFKLAGTVEATFGPNQNGTVRSHFGESRLVTEGYDVAIQSDGKIVVVGAANNTDDALIVRYMPDGSLDKSFDGDGARFVDFGFFSNEWWFNAVTIQS